MSRLRAESVDAPAAIALLNEYMAFRADGFPGGGYQRSPADASAFVPPVGVFLVFTDDDGVDVGCGGVRRIEAPAGTGVVRFEVKHLYMRASARGSGGGSALLAGLEERARGFGATELVLDTHHSLDAAGRLYARAGFTAIAAYNDNPNATVWLRKSLKRD
ncbi:GNAT superfamily N-acetyltransferase [Microbacterium endophyticum]|uniref:GNAT superfamily N-acetyltransferase n=1 Tax=Microbacterium endophyticum TaxID=1526412 RepID=A0A7W4V0Y9_9MICO|nr:GNAT family N-acetyltransferase [Microbacterium endophyticum]MBB2974848.1 GNAT superfamily N-acetyltransferase [Microbacterium endophyticum]NIK37145.1 GNAT superfamily N-acetyltransferase [Microbacterium endophyticum]